jgi:long-chain fatty acid transport protein
MKYHKLKLLVILIAVAVLLPSSVFGHGWGGYEQGAKAHGMGGAFTGLADDPSAVYYNPAGIVQLDNTQASLGFAIPTIRGHFKSNGTSGIPGAESGDETDLKDQYFFIPNFYLTSKINEKLSLGFGEYTIFGLGFDWPNSFEGRYAPGGKNGQLETMTISPVAAYQITDKLSFALGGRVERADLLLDNKIFVAPGVDDVRSKISGDDYGVAWNTALLYKLCDDIRAGLNYRSKMKHSFNDLDVDFTPQIDKLGPIPVGILNTEADLDVTLPQFASLGLAWSKGPLTITLDGYWWDWSEIKELDIKFNDPVAGATSMVTPMDWDDTWTWAIGAEYVINACDRDVSLRGGFMYEQCPTPSKTVIPPGFNGDNLLYNIGVGSMIGPFYSDFFLTYVYTKDQTWNNTYSYAPNPGGGPVTGEFEDYNTFIVGSNITYKF